MKSVLIALALVAQAQTPTPLPAPLPNEVMVQLVKASPGFGAASGRTGIRISKSMEAPNSEGRGAFSEVYWQHQGVEQVAIALFARTDAVETKDLTFVSKVGNWGLANLIEGKNLRDLINDLERSRDAGHEMIAQGRVRQIQLAQEEFFQKAKGFAPDLGCLLAPAKCGVNIDGPFLPEDWGVASSGYTHVIEPGQPMPGGKLVRRFAVIATPVKPTLPTYCGDSTGAMCARPPNTSIPPTGACGTPCTVIK